MWLMGGRLGGGNTPQDQSFHFIKSHPDWLHSTSIREGFGFQHPTLDEESAYTHRAHINRGQDKSETGPQLTLESVSWGWHCAAQHFDNAAQRSATPRETDFKARRSSFSNLSRPGVCGHGVCLHSLHSG
jgi:hypothetical protein